MRQSPVQDKETKHQQFAFWSNTPCAQTLITGFPGKSKETFTFVWSHALAVLAAMSTDSWQSQAEKGKRKRRS